jgi:hypothetical protein
MRVADLEDDSQSLQDASATWMLGHTERITMGKPYVDGIELLVDATIHVPCKYLEVRDAKSASKPNGHPRVRCTAYGFRGPMPYSSQPAPEERHAFRRGGNRFSLVYKGKRRVLDLPRKRSSRRTLPVMHGKNPCLDAPCRTADNKRGAACCRDLTLDLVLPKSSKRMEALLRSRKSPYLCKVDRDGPDSVEVEVISACGYLGDDGLSCVLHDRVLPNGRVAKPSICFEWPDLGPDDAGHPGCALT